MGSSDHGTDHPDRGSAMTALSGLVDLILLNLLVLLCSLPIVTAGASLTAMHYVLFRMARGEEGYITRSFWKSFRENFRQATVLWLLFLAFLCLLYVDLRLAVPVSGSTPVIPQFFTYLIAGGGIYVSLMYLYVFPLLARYHNTVFGTLRNASFLVTAALPRTVAMAAAAAALPALVWLMPPLSPILLLLGWSGPGLVHALLYRPVFRKIEKHIPEDPEE